MAPLAQHASPPTIRSHGWTDPEWGRGRGAGEAPGRPAAVRYPARPHDAGWSADGVRSVGAADYLKKPFEPETLLDVVSRHAHGGVGGGMRGPPPECHPRESSGVRQGSTLHEERLPWHKSGGIHR